MFTPASIDWCEKNYVYTPYIAEFWNTVSGSILCLSSILFYYLYIYKKVEYNKYIQYANIWLFIVGVGTIFFHGTLLYIFQLFDEIPMLMISLQYLKLNLKIADKLNIKTLQEFNNSNDIFCQGKLFIRDSPLIIFSIIFSYYIYAQLQSIFFLLFFIYSIYLIFFQIKAIQDFFWLKLYRVNLENNSNKLDYSNKSLFKIGLNNTCNHFNIYKQCKFRKKLLEKILIYNTISISLFIMSLIIWACDSLFCEYFEKYKFHAIWHILTSIALYFCNLIMNTHVKLAATPELNGDGL